MLIYIKKIIQLKRVVKGYLFKWSCDYFGFGKVNIVTITDRTPQLIVSLTSYGRRVADIVPYTLVSLLKQTVMPDRIILWLDKESWNDENIPKKLQQLIKYGIEIRFCKDIRSYTKLVPTLTLYPEDVIVTVDDDVIYKRDVVENLYSSYLKDSSKIYCNHARFPAKDKFGEFRPYQEWGISRDSKSYIMPLGVGGVLYPPHSLHPDTIKEDIFTELCPIADDLWFWIMAIRNNFSHKVIRNNENIGDSFDDLYQFFHKRSALTHSNRKENKNDIQLSTIIRYYALCL